MDAFIALWHLIFLDPMTNILLVFSQGLWGSFGLAIIALTIIVRILIFPLTWKQLQSTKSMMALQPKMQELQKKYAKDKQKLSAETMKLYREHKINPLGCLLPMLVQLPIWIALYQSVWGIMRAIPDISRVPGLYSWSIVHQEFPNMNFLGLDLGQSPWGAAFWLVILVAGSMYILQKMSTMPSADPKQQRMTRMMTVIFPLMFGFITLTLPAGLGLYFLMSNIIGIIMQYFVTGWGSLRLPAAIREKVPVERLPAWMRRTGTSSPPPTKGERTGHGKHREKR